MESRITRQDVTFGMTVPETGAVMAAFEITLRTQDGRSHRFSYGGRVSEMLAGPISVTTATMLTVESRPSPPSLRRQLTTTLWDNRNATLDDQVAALLEAISERPSLLDDLEELTSGDRD